MPFSTPFPSVEQRCRAQNGYEQATADLEVDSHPVVSAWLRAAGLVPAVSAAMLATHGVRPAAFDDIFVVKYHEAQQRALPRHVDAGEVSFMLALSSRAAYDGGGTAFDALSPCGDAVPGEPRAPLHLDQVSSERRCHPGGELNLW